MGKDKQARSSRSNEKWHGEMNLPSKSQKRKLKTQQMRKLKAAASNNAMAKDYFEFGTSANLNYRDMGIAIDPNKPQTQIVETLSSRKIKPEVDKQTKFLTEVADLLQKETDYPFELSKPAPEVNSILKRFNKDYLDSLATLITHWELRLGKKAEAFTDEEIKQMVFSKVNIFQLSFSQLRSMIRAYVEDSKKIDELMAFSKESLQIEQQAEDKRKQMTKSLLEKEKKITQKQENPESAVEEQKPTSTTTTEVQKTDAVPATNNENNENKNEQTSTSEKPAEAQKTEEKKEESASTLSQIPQKPDELKEMDVDDEEEEEEKELTPQEKEKADNEMQQKLQAKRDNNETLTNEEKKLLKKLKRRQKKREQKRGVTFYGDTIVSNKTGKMVERVVPKFIEKIEVYTYKQKKKLG